jgi:hypothetical protein
MPHFSIFSIHFLFFPLSIFLTPSEPLYLANIYLYLDLIIDNNFLTQLEDDLLDDIIIQTTIQYLQSRRRVPRPMRTGLPGGVYIQELLDSDNQERIKQVLRITKPTCFALRDWLLNYTVGNTVDTELYRREEVKPRF